MNHPTEIELSGYRERTLTPEALLRVTGHLAGCEDCRSKLRSAMRSGAALAELRQTVEDHQPNRIRRRWNGRGRARRG